MPDPKGPSAIIISQLQYSTSLLVTQPNIYKHGSYTLNIQPVDGIAHAVCHDFHRDKMILLLKVFTDVPVLLGKKTDASQKLGFAHSTHYMVSSIP